MTQTFKKSSLGFRAKRSFFSIAAAAIGASMTVQLSEADVIVANDKVDETIRKIKAGQFLSQTTLGALPWEISNLAEEIRKNGETKAFNTWLDNEFAKGYQSITDYVDQRVKDDGFTNVSWAGDFNSEGVKLNTQITNYQEYAWWDRAVRANDRLRQRVAWGLIQIFVTSGNADPGTLSARWRQPLSYYDVLLKNSFTDYRSLIEDVTYHPFMGFYLSHLRNNKGDPAKGIFPDENYAREILQLFSMGVYKLNNDGEFALDANGDPIELYDNDVIREYAKVFTGLSYKPRTQPGSFFGNPRNYTGPMQMYDANHDKSEKYLLHGKLSANQDGNTDISQALNGIANHTNVPPFLSRLLIQRFTSSNPSSSYINAVANAWKKDPVTGKRGQMKAVLREIFMNPEARNSLEITKVALAGNQTKIVVKPKDELHGRVKEPILMMTQYLRRYWPVSDEKGGFFKPMSLGYFIGQTPLRAPHVFNYYSSEFQPGTGPLYDKIVSRNERLVAPESEIVPSTAIKMFESFKLFTQRGWIQQNNLSTTTNAQMDRINNAKAVERDVSWLINDLNINLCYGTMPQALQDKIADAMNSHSRNDYEQRFSRVMAIVLNSADFAVDY